MSGRLAAAAARPQALGMGWIGKIFGGKTKRMPLHVDDGNFEAEVLRSSVPVILDIWSPGCAPCKRLEEVMVHIATEYGDQVKVCELGTHASPKTSMRLRVAATPTVIYFDKGREKERVAGFRGSVYHCQTIEEVFGLQPE